MVAAGAAKVEREEFLGYELRRLVPLRAADTGVFAAAEVEPSSRCSTIWKDSTRGRSVISPTRKPLAVG